MRCTRLCFAALRKAGERDRWAAAAPARQGAQRLGIAPDVLPHTFERFYRDEVSRSGVSTGLESAIAKKMIEAQGGAISVESQLGQGSVFTVTLPRASYAS